MIDAHIHIARIDGQPILDPSAVIKASFERYAELGISAVRDGGDASPSISDIARRAADLTGVIYKTPIYALVKRGGYGAFLGREIDASDIRSTLADLRRRGADFIKVIQSGIVSFDSYGEISPGGFTPHELEYITSSAHDYGLRVMAHCNGERLVDMALASCVDSIEHGYFIGHGQLDAMKELGTVWTPTFVPLSNYLASGNAAQNQAKIISDILNAHAANLRYAVSIGVRVAIGSDAGAVYVPHADGAFDELDYFVQAGIDRSTALDLALTNGALALGLADK